MKWTDGAIDMVSLIITMVIAAVTMMIGLVVVSNMEKVVSDIPSSSPVFNTTVQQTTETVGTAFNFLALGLFVLAAVFILAIVGTTIGGGPTRRSSSTPRSTPTYTPTYPTYVPPTYVPPSQPAPSQPVPSQPTTDWEGFGGSTPSSGGSTSDEMQPSASAPASGGQAWKSEADQEASKHKTRKYELEDK